MPENKLDIYFCDFTYCGTKYITDPKHDAVLSLNFDKWSPAVYLVKIYCKDGKVITKKVVKI